jgi:inner membrane protease subunit 1
MLPTLSAFGNYVIINKSYRRGRGVEVGDIVSFKHPVREGEYAVKRVLGLEGDFVLMYTPGANDTMLQVRITDDIVQNSHLDCLR